jgi:hypothetical protein
MRPRSAGLLAPRPLGPTLVAFVLLRRCGLARIIVFRRRVRGVPQVAGQQVLQPGQLPRQRLVGLHQLRELPGHRGDLPAWRRTTTISSSRDISSGPDTRRSNRTPADHSVIDTHMSPTAQHATGIGSAQVRPRAEYLRPVLRHQSAKHDNQRPPHLASQHRPARHYPRLRLRTPLGAGPTGLSPASSLRRRRTLRDGPPACPASVLRPHSFRCLGFSLSPTSPTPGRPYRGEAFPSSALEPRLSSRHLCAGHHQANKQAPTWFIPGQQLDPGFDVVATLSRVHQ